MKKCKKIAVFVILIILIIVAISYVGFKTLYNKDIDYIQSQNEETDTENKEQRLEEESSLNNEESVVKVEEDKKTDNDSNSTQGNVNNISNQSTITQTNTENSKTKTNNDISEVNNGDNQEKGPISKEEAIRIWKNNIPNFGKNNNIINYKDYTVMINISQVEVRPNSQFTQTDNALVRQADYTRKVWKIETAEDTDAFQVLDVYVDLYTGEIIGGRIHGD